MTTLRLVRAVTAAVVTGVIAGCNHATEPTTTLPRPQFVKITGPSTMAPGQTARYTATAYMSNNTTQDYTQTVIWTASPASVIAIGSNTGEATAQTSGDATISASVPNHCCAIPNVTTTVLPPNTYRLTGKVLESTLPVQSAVVAVLSGVGSGLSATTDFSGAYRLYGVAGPIQVKVSKAGYDDIIQAFDATQNDVLDFPTAHQIVIPSFAGQYTLTLLADPACPTSVPPGQLRALPDELRAPRSYSVSVTQDGPSLTASVTGAAIVTPHDHFTGRVEPDVTEFLIGSGYLNYGLDDGIAEQVSSTETFVFGGELAVRRSGTAWTGLLKGPLEVYTPSTPGSTRYVLTTQCVGSNTQVTLTPVARPSHR